MTLMTMTKLENQGKTAHPKQENRVRSVPDLILLDRKKLLEEIKVDFNFKEISVVILTMARAEQDIKKTAT